MNPKTCVLAFSAVIVSLAHAQTWTQEAQLTPADLTAQAQFGGAVSISGTNVLVGAFAQESPAGAAYIFSKQASGWSQIAELTSPGSMSFGWSVALSGSLAVVGAPATNSSQGSAHIFLLENGTWVHIQDLRASDHGAGYQFGCSVALSGTTILVGSLGFAGDAGAVYAFDFNGTKWLQSAEIKPTDSASNEEFGSSISASGSSIIVGARLEHAGYILDNPGSGWVQTAKLQPNVTSGLLCGESVAISGRAAFLGCSSIYASGVAFLYGKIGNTWTLSQYLTSPAGPKTEFAAGGAIAGRTLAIGEPYGVTGIETVYFYDLTTGAWNEIQSVSQDSYFGNFGISIALDQDFAVIGAPYTAGTQGTVFIYSTTTN